MKLLDTILDLHPKHTIRIPRMILEEVGRNLTSEEYREFIEYINNITNIDEDFFVPFEIGVRYELLGLKPADAFIGAYVEWTGADILITENRHFLRLHSLPFKIMTATNFLNFITTSL